MLATIDNNPWHALTAGLLCLVAIPIILEFYPKFQQGVRDTFGNKEHPARDDFQRIGVAIFLGLAGLPLVIGAVLHLS